jgi:hypothetical protein
MKSFKVLIFGLLLALSSVVVVTARTLEDAKAAFARGDYATALQVLRALAEQGSAVAQNDLAIMYADGRFVPQDYGEAIRWFRLAAHQGLADAQVSLGFMYDGGRGVAQDYGEAVKWYRLAAEQGHAGGQVNLGVMYERGRGVPQDDAEAAKWYRLAAEQGLADAQRNLGFMYVEGRGVPQDHGEAVKWFRLGADQGHAGSQFNLGVMYDEGLGVPRDDAEAAKWYRLAAEQGFADAQNNLGAMYLEGSGVPQDYVSAYLWFYLAAEQYPSGPRRDNAVRARNMASSQLASGQIAEAARLVREWTPAGQSTSTAWSLFMQAGLQLLALWEATPSDFQRAMTIEFRAPLARCNPDRLEDIDGIIEGMLMPEMRSQLVTVERFLAHKLSEIFTETEVRELSEFLNKPFAAELFDVLTKQVVEASPDPTVMEAYVAGLTSADQAEYRRFVESPVGQRMTQDVLSGAHSLVDDIFAPVTKAVLVFQGMGIKLSC